MCSILLKVSSMNHVQAGHSTKMYTSRTSVGILIARAHDSQAKKCTKPLLRVETIAPILVLKRNFFPSTYAMYVVYLARCA